MKQLNRVQLGVRIEMNRTALAVRLRERHSVNKAIRELDAAIGADQARIEFINGVCVTG